MIERRLGNRQVMRSPAKIIDDSGNLTEVKIVDLSATGARIETVYGATRPRRFILRLDKDGRTFPGELAWRRGCEAGLRFPDCASEQPVLDEPTKGVGAASMPAKGSDLRKMMKFGVQ